MRERVAKIRLCDNIIRIVIFAKCYLPIAARSIIRYERNSLTDNRSAFEAMPKLCAVLRSIVFSSSRITHFDEPEMMFLHMCEKSLRFYVEDVSQCWHASRERRLPSREWV